MLKKLKKICANKKLCEIYHNVDDTSKFMVGYVLACNDNDAVLWLIDRYGHFDGISWILNGEIYRINTNTEYLKACHRLLEYNGLEVMYTFSESSLEDIIKRVHSGGRICELELCASDNTDVSGYITAVSKTSISLKVVNEYGEYDGDNVIDKSSISILTLDSTDTCKLEILNKK